MLSKDEKYFDIEQTNKSKILEELEVFLNEEEKIKEIFERLEARNPKPQTELIFDSPFQLLVAVILSAQTTDKAVNKVTPELLK